MQKNTGVHNTRFYAITYPSLVGQTVIRQAGSSSDSSSSRILAFPDYSSGGIGFAPFYSGGTVSDFHRASLLSPCGHLLLLY